MNYKSTTYSSFDGMKLSGYIWEPKENPKAIINLVHGFGEYSERYDQWAMRFTDKGFLVHAIDYRGHGKSEGKRGHISNFEEFLNDIDVIVKGSKKLYPELPQYIYGHSLGGNIVTNYILKRNNDFKGAIISSPWYKLSFNPSAFMLFLARIMNKVYPKFTQKSKLELNALTHDKKVVDDYLEDPLVHEKISTRMFFEIYKSGDWILENAKKINLPVLIQHGNSDKITSYKASKEFAEKAKELNKEVDYKEWPGLYHELHNELQKEEIFDFILKWIEKSFES
ncbi:MAG: lysophospholipase [Bacteroidales bacterium]|jgi:acylglycerol lipase|nr:lysophospholipase [Bacteroidales bacterium]